MPDMFVRIAMIDQSRKARKKKRREILLLNLYAKYTVIDVTLAQPGQTSHNDSFLFNGLTVYI
ncbi:hypothetical protein A8V49_10360 [Yersinia pestis]|nr:hypothetical protein A8V49_10360 [Yersinia pestis]